MSILHKNVKVLWQPVVHQILKVKLKEEDAFKSGDRALYKEAKYDVERAIREAKTDHRRKREGQFLSNLRALSGTVSCALVATSKSLPPIALIAQNIYARFDRQNSTPISVRLPDNAVQEHEVRKLLNQQTSRNAAGPDTASTATLKHCAN